MILTTLELLKGALHRGLIWKGTATECLILFDNNLILDTGGVDITLIALSAVPGSLFLVLKAVLITKQQQTEAFL